MSGTFLGFDFGTKSIGVAVGQRITATARPLPALKAQDGKPDWNVIEKLLKEWQPEAVIVGLPLNMDGTEQPLTARARISPIKFVAALASRSFSTMNG